MRIKKTKNGYKKDNSIFYEWLLAVLCLVIFCFLVFLKIIF
jgi:hypothetical protein